ncbi:MAG TPA: aminopeptidase, partial [Thermomicrobiales bacterium]|nr:aminopeptidase [Thermomicrobiales bacterium]
MADLRIDTWADILVNFSVKVQPGQTVSIQGGVAGGPLMRAVFRQVIKAGGYPIVLPALSGLNAV